MTPLSSIRDHETPLAFNRREPHREPDKRAQAQARVCQESSQRPLRQQTAFPSDVRRTATAANSAFRSEDSTDLRQAAQNKVYRKEANRSTRSFHQTHANLPPDIYYTTDNPAPNYSRENFSSSSSRYPSFFGASNRRHASIHRVSSSSHSSNFFQLIGKVSKFAIGIICGLIGGAVIGAIASPLLILPMAILGTVTGAAIAARH